MSEESDRNSNYESYPTEDSKIIDREKTYAILQWLNQNVTRFL